MSTPEKKNAPGQNPEQKPMTTTPNKSEDKKDTDPEFEQSTPHKAQPERANEKNGTKRAPADDADDDVDGDLMRDNVAQNPRNPKQNETTRR